MSKYINADTVIQALRETIDRCKDSESFTRTVRAAENMILIIDRTPAADVVEVKHGEWIDGNRQTWNGTYWFIYCSECLHERKDCNHDNDTPFCPNCGADMRGETE